MKSNTLDAIRIQYGSNIATCFREMLKERLKCITPPLTWRTLLKALRSPIIDEGHLAKQLELEHHKEGTHACILKQNLSEMFTECEHLL